MMKSIRLCAGESGVPLVPFKKNFLMKNQTKRNSRAARKTIIRIRIQRGRELDMNALPAAPMRLLVMMDGTTPVATVKMYFL